QLSVGTDFERAEAEIILARRLNRLIEDDLVIAAADRLAIPRPVLRAARLESPPIEEIAVTDRDRAVVFLDPAFHLFEQLVDQMLVPLFPVLEIIVFGAEIVEHVGITDLRIFGVPQPVPRVVDRDPVPLVAVGPLFGLRRGRNVGLLVHASALSAPARYRKRKSAMSQWRRWVNQILWNGRTEGSLQFGASVPQCSSNALVRIGVRGMLRSALGLKIRPLVHPLPPLDIH